MQPAALFLHCQPYEQFALAEDRMKNYEFVLLFKGPTNICTHCKFISDILSPYSND